MIKYIKVSKAEYYSWKAYTFVLLFCVLVLIFINQQKYYVGEINDDYYHKGIYDCHNNVHNGIDVRFMYRSNSSTLCELKLNGTLAVDGYCYYPK